MTKIKLSFSRHPDSRLQFSWNSAQLGLLLFPFNPFLGLVCLGWALQGIWRRQFRTIINRPLNWGFAILSLLLTIGAFFGYDRTTALLGLFNLLPFFIIFAGYSALFQTIEQLRRMAWIIVIPSVPIVLTGLGQLFLGWNLKINILAVLSLTIVVGGNPPGRMSSIFMYANTFAGYLVIAFILAFGLWLETFQKYRLNTQQSTSNSQQPTVNNLLFLTFAVITNLLGLILTNSRNAWVLAVIACFGFAIYQGWRILVAFVTAAVSSVLLAAFAPSPIAEVFRKFVPALIWARLNDDMFPDRPVAMMRKTQWEFALSLTEQRPWTGWGLRNFTQIYLQKMNIWLGHPHNLFLMMSAETGLPATILFCGLLAWIFISIFKVWVSYKDIYKEDKLILFSYALVFISLILFNTVDVSLFDLRLNVLFWLLLSAIYGVVYRIGSLQTSSIRSSRV
jgi:O-antigen ligase